MFEIKIMDKYKEFYSESSHHIICEKYESSEDGKHIYPVICGMINSRLITAHCEIKEQ